MEISQKFAEQQMLLHKTEFEKWKKIYESFGEKSKRKVLTNKEQDAIMTAKIKAYYNKLNLRHAARDKK